MAQIIPWPAVPNLVVIEGGLTAPATLGGELALAGGTAALTLLSPEILAAMGLGVGAGIALSALADSFRKAGLPNVPKPWFPAPKTYDPSNYPVGTVFQVDVTTGAGVGGSSGRTDGFLMKSYNGVFLEENGAPTDFSRRGLVCYGIDQYGNPNPAYTIFTSYPVSVVVTPKLNGEAIPPVTDPNVGYPKVNGYPQTLPVGSPVPLVSIPGASVTPQILQPYPQISPPQPDPYSPSPPEFIPIALPEVGQQIQISPEGIRFVPYAVPGSTVGTSSLPQSVKNKPGREPNCDCIPNIEISPCDLTPVLNKLNQIEAELNPQFDYHSSQSSETSGTTLTLNQIPRYIQIDITQFPENIRKQPSPSGVTYYWLGYVVFTIGSDSLGPRELINGLRTVFLVPQGCTHAVVTLYTGVLCQITQYWKTPKA